GDVTSGGPGAPGLAEQTATNPPLQGSGNPSTAGPSAPSNRPPTVPPPQPAAPIVIGTAVDNNEAISIPVEALRKHVAIFAGSGSGKTVLIRRLVEECALRGISSIVLDPGNDLARLGDPWPGDAVPAGWSDEDRARAEEYLANT